MGTERSEPSEPLPSAPDEMLEELADQFEELLASMQGPRAEAAFAALFAATPDELGRAAVEAACSKPAPARRKR